jgi:DNA helicase-2/ATP-dependent DNA helicase PcrA
MVNSSLPPPTPQGQQIIEAWLTPLEPIGALSSVKSSLMINAYAGTGKTTFLQQLAPHIKEPKVLMLAFNKKNALDLEAKMPAHFDCATMNSIGHRALQKVLSRKLRVEGNKTANILKQVAQAWNLGRLDDDTYSNITTLVRLAKSSGLMHSSYSGFKSLLPDNSDSWELLGDSAMIDFHEDIVRFARAVLRVSIQEAMHNGYIDYDDQIYLSVLANGAYEKYPVVAVDEAQDLSALNHLQLQKSLAIGGRLIAVGDPKQAIYAFRGASSKSMAQIKNLRPDTMLEFPLSLTFRCSKLVVARNQGHAPGFEAAPANKDGVLLDFRNKPEWTWDDLPSERKAILCRNNAPLLDCAFRLIKSGRGVTMLGRDIGKSLIALLHKIVGTREIPVSEAMEKIRRWKDKEIDLALANGKEEKMAGIEDRADSLIAVAESIDDPESSSRAIEAAITELFENQSGLITLGTGHRAKGLEWPVVIHLDPWRLPSKHAKSASERGDPTPMEQEMNLKYVIETRSQEYLVLANLNGFEP